MKSIWKLFYNYLIIPPLYIFLQLGSLFNSKIKRGIRGRKRIFEELILNAASLDKSRKLIWFHSSSLGEFEQAKPIIQELKKDNNINILITFFSPSGYENSRKYPYADLVSYLPFDSKAYADRFISIIRPDLAILMRYDIWPNHIWALKKRNIPCFIVDATMKTNSPRKIPVIKNFHKVLFKDITRILTVSDSDVAGFKGFKIESDKLTAVGDTRFDRVYEKSIAAKGKNIIRENLLQDKKIFVAGSTWDMDENVILPAFVKLSKYDKEVILILVPHEPTIENLERIENELSGTMKTIRFSHLNSYKDERIIIVDSIGILLTLYAYGDLAFVGGSFKQNIHNVLEAAVYGMPVFFGPRIENSQESKELLKRGGAVLIRNKREAYRQLRTYFLNDELRNERGRIASDYVKDNLGATKKILKEIYKEIER
jgi:3-deoxy-D-manno-octulosonic-acid transferase